MGSWVDRAIVLSSIVDWPFGMTASSCPCLSHLWQTVKSYLTFVLWSQFLWDFRVLFMCPFHDCDLGIISAHSLRFPRSCRDLFLVPNDSNGFELHGTYCRCPYLRDHGYCQRPTAQLSLVISSLGTPSADDADAIYSTNSRRPSCQISSMSRSLALLLGSCRS